MKIKSSDIKEYLEKIACEDTEVFVRPGNIRKRWRKSWKERSNLLEE